MEKTTTTNPLETALQRAIDAKNNHKDNYHKWMTYYYVANGAILVAITSLVDKEGKEPAILLLGIVGIMTGLFWNLSCKGYYYWSLNWIEIVTRLERKIYGEDSYGRVYSVFSKNVSVNNDHRKFGLSSPANISTPKLTMLFSFLTLIGWCLFTLCWQWMGDLFPFAGRLGNVSISLVILGLTLFFYIFFQSKLKSRQQDTHTLVE